MSAAVAAAAAAATCSSRNNSSSSIHRTTQNHHHHHEYSIADHRRRPAVVLSTSGCRYESRKRKEWISFIEFMREKRPGLLVSACSGGDVVEFLKHYLDGDGENNNKVTQQQVYWGSVEAIIGRLRVAFEEMGGQALAHTATTNPFNAPEVRLYLSRLKDAHSQHHYHHQQQQQLISSFNNVSLYHNYL